MIRIINKAPKNVKRQKKSMPRSALERRNPQVSQGVGANRIFTTSAYRSTAFAKPGPDRLCQTNHRGFREKCSSNNTLTGLQAMLHKGLNYTGVSNLGDKRYFFSIESFLSAT